MKHCSVRISGSSTIATVSVLDKAPGQQTNLMRWRKPVTNPGLRQTADRLNSLYTDGMPMPLLSSNNGTIY